MKSQNKYGQVTLFVIISIIVVGAVILFLMLSDTKLPIIEGTKTTTNPSIFMESCIDDQITEGIKLLSKQGGNIEPKLYTTFKLDTEDIFEDISYLCYAKNDYLSCVNQEPVLEKHLEEELQDYISNKVESCFNDLTASLDKQGYVVDARYRSFNIEISSRKIETNINSEIILTKSGETTTQNNIKTYTPSNLHSFLRVIREIVNKEATECDFDLVRYTTIYPEWEIDKFKILDSSKIYIITDKTTQEKFRFAIRGCVIP